MLRHMELGYLLDFRSCRVCNAGICDSSRVTYAAACCLYVRAWWPDDDVNWWPSFSQSVRVLCVWLFCWPLLPFSISQHQYGLMI